MSGAAGPPEPERQSSFAGLSHGRQVGQWTQELTRSNLQAVARLERKVLEGRSWDDRLIDTAVAWFGSKSFAYLNALWFAGWILGNSRLVTLHPFDPFPFELLTLAVSLEAIFLSIFLLISQNRERIWTERRSHLDLQLNLLSEQENTAQMAILVQIANKLGIEVCELPRDMLDPTEPEAIVDRLDEVFAAGAQAGPEGDGSPKA